jgi:3-isopropylmalate/(R)-2-methylmalate dehydratase small subunit
MKTFGGPVLFLDRSNINTDEIIPAKYLTEVDKDALKPNLLEDLKIEGFVHNGPEMKKARVVVTRKNFGCGSSREHAPWALEVNGITVVVAVSYARIFRQNMFNGGMLAIEASDSDIDAVFALSKKGEVTCSVDIDSGKLLFRAPGNAALEIKYSLTGFDDALVRAGGWVEFADKRY